MSIICATCGVEFNRPNSLGRLPTTCAACKDTRRKEYHRAWARQWRSDNPEKDARNRESTRTPRYLRAQTLRRFGVTPEQYDEMLEAQGGVCAICKQPERTIDARNGNLRSLAVDHCHATDKVRGLLCGSCNRALGLLKDDQARIESALIYLRAA